MKIKYYRSLLLVFTIGIGILPGTGCKKLVEAELPIDRLTAKAVFDDVSGTSAALSNIYYLLPGLVAGEGGLSVINGLTSDELFLRNINNQELQAFFTNSLSSKKSGKWSMCYDLIFRINSVMEGVENSTGLLNHSKNEFIGQAKFLRAFVYFYLVNLYGGVPVITSTDYKTNMLLPRNIESAVYDQILSDLTDAQSLVNENYLKTDLISVSSERVTANKAVVTAFLARVYLYRGQWAKAEQEATKIINDSRYTILKSLNEVFLSNSTEAIWQIEGDVSIGNNSTDGNFFNPGSLAENRLVVCVSDNLLHAFDSNDKRLTNWITSVPIGTIEFYYPFKYKERNSDAGSGILTTEYNMILRLAEQYLIRSEARAYLNNLNGAMDDLNVIRDRAGVAPLNSLDQQGLIRAIEQERNLELFSECGHRWFDLKRTGRADEVLAPIKGSDWQPTDKLFPIPSREFGLNPSLRGHQNPGYSEN